MGAKGWVAGLVCAFPKETVSIYQLIQAGRIQEVIDIFRSFLPLLELDINPKLVQNIKLAEELVGLGTEIVRPPGKPLHGKERDLVLDIIKRGIASRPVLHHGIYEGKNTSRHLREILTNYLLNNLAPGGK